MIRFVTGKTFAAWPVFASSILQFLTGTQNWLTLTAELLMGIAPAKLFVADLGERAVVRITGRANCLSSVPFKQVINGLIERGRRAFTLDLSDCQLMDSTFLGVLVGLNRTLGQAGPDGGFSLYQPTEPVRILLDNLGILELFSTAESLDQAEAAEPVEAGEAPDKTELTRTSLEAHQTLTDANPENAVRFKEVTRFLEEDLKQQEAADSPD
jgi:anti-anti-sigma factor